MMCSATFQIMPSFLNVIRTCDPGFREVKKAFYVYQHVGAVLLLKFQLSDGGLMLLR